MNYEKIIYRLGYYNGYEKAMNKVKELMKK